MGGRDVALAIACVGCLGWLLVIRGSAIRLAALHRALRAARSPAASADFSADFTADFSADVTAAAAAGTSFSLIVPARREAAVLPATLTALAGSSHPRFEILVVVEAADTSTLRAARTVSDEAPDRIRVLVRSGGQGIKAAALNYALPHCRNDVVGVFDADGIVHPDLLRAVDERFTVSGVDAVQAGNQPLAGRPRWYQLHNMIEFYFMFRNESAQAPARLVRLSGNSVFVRTSLLREVGGWHEAALAEDCDLSIRLTACGARLTFLYQPELATLEETPVGLAAFVRQRTRWNQGFIQVLRADGWRRLPARGLRWSAAQVLLTVPVRALLGIVLPVQVVAAAVAGSPLVWAPAAAALPGAISACLATGLLAPFGRDFDFPVRRRHYAQLALGWPAYQLLLTLPAIRAAIRQLSGHGDWEKTTHVGLQVTERS